MRSALLLVLALALDLTACSGGSTPSNSSPSTPAPSQEPEQPPVAPGPATPALMTPEDCTAKGGTVKGDIGDGKVACAEGERELGKVKTGIEGGVCCASGTTP